MISARSTASVFMALFLLATIGCGSNSSGDGAGGGSGSGGVGGGGASKDDAGLEGSGDVGTVGLSTGGAGGVGSSSAPATVAGDGGTTTTSGTCAKITLADVQALVPAIVSHSDTDPINCRYVFADGKSLDVTDFTADADMFSYKNISLPNDQPISGIGDEAYWNEVLDGTSAPELAAHKGNRTCVIQSDDPPNTTLKTTSTPSGYSVAPADALAYVQLMGKVCNDLFANQSNQ